MAWLTANDPLTAMPRTWYADISPPYAPAPALQGTTRTETCVIGGGLTGLSAALHLAQAGRAVVVVEAARAGWGASGRNGGQVGRGYNWDAPELARALGLGEARALWAMADAAADLTRDLIAAHAPEANYRPGVLYLARSDAGVDRHRSLAGTMREDFGDTQIQILDAGEVARITGSAAFRGGALDRASGHCNPLAYTQGLARAARTAGVRLYEGTAVRQLIPGAPYRIHTQAGEVIADRVILATNGYHDGLVPRVANHVLPINNYIAVTEPLGDRAPMTAGHAAVDDRFVVNYWHQSTDGRLVYGGGENYGKRFPKDIAAKVRRNLARVYPDLAQVPLTHAWGGTLAVTTTRLPYAAELAPGLLTVGGYSGHGLALAGFAGRAMAHRFLGDGHDFDRLTRLPCGRLPGGRWLGPWITGAAMVGFSLRDRLGL